MICPVCNGDGYTEDNPKDMPLIRKYSFNVCAFKCWKCEGLGSYTLLLECYDCGNEIKDFELVDGECPYCNATEFMEK